MAEIDVRGLRFSYREGPQPVAALNGVDLTVADGEFLCVVGPSGGGKSTLLRLLAGLERPGEGKVSIGCRAVTGPGSDRMIVFQDYALFPWLTAEGNVSFALRHGKHMPGRDARKLAREWLDRVGLSQGAERYPFQLSGGMCQRVAIARALAMDPEVLLLDEPFGALDEKIRSELQRQLLELWQGSGEKTVVMVTHDIREAIRLADRIVFMEHGVIRGEFPVTARRPREDTEALREQILRRFEEAVP